MEFDCEKVLTPFTANKEKWIGCEGWFEDDASCLKFNVESNNKDYDYSYGIFSKIDEDYDTPFIKRGACYGFRFFYPVESPAKKPNDVMRNEGGADDI